VTSVNPHRPTGDDRTSRGRRRVAGLALTVLLVPALGAGCWRRKPPPPTAEGDGGLSSEVFPPGTPPPRAGDPPTSPLGQGAKGSPAALASAVPTVILPGGASAPMSFSSLVKTADPAVVTIFAYEAERRGGRRMRVAEGLGSGFVYEPSGYILTNNHVVAKATEIVVRMADERRLPARLVGRDPPTDVAVLKVEVKDAPFLSLGDSDSTDVGDWVVAIGNPFGLSHTVSAGIVSAKGRTREDLADLDKTGHGYFNFLQTDAAINQGNSGGPLMNIRGDVVGINTAIRANANSIGFAIPINMVKSLVPMLVREGKVRRSALGITVHGVAEEDMARLRRSDKKGALVRGVQPGGAADKAGIAPDDVIVAFNGVAISDPEELRWQASISGIGNTALVRLARGDRQFDVRVTLGALPEEQSDEPAPPGGLAPGRP
jgi:serine protease Do